LPWFRIRRQKQDLPVAVEAIAPEAEPTEVEQAPEADEQTPGTDGEAPKPRRRRGSRGGRGRRKPAAAADGNGEPQTSQTTQREAPAAKAETTPDRGTKKRSSNRERSSGRERRRQTQRRAPLPQAKRELLISVDVGEQRVALLEDDRVAEVYLERPERRSIAGNIYLGTVDNVLPGMEAAFVERTR